MYFFDKVRGLKYPWEKYYKKNERSVEVPDCSLYNYFFNNAQFYMEEVAINYFGNKIKYRELIKQVDLCAKALKSHGVRSGDVVSICMPNTPEAVISLYAVSKIGAIASMIHPLSAEEEIKYSLKSTKSVFLIAIDLSYKSIKNIINDTDIYKCVLVSAADSMPANLSFLYRLANKFKIEKPKEDESYLSWHSFVSRGNNYNSPSYVQRGKDDDALILHSGGTTGVPKNIVLTNGNANVIMEQARIIFPKVGVKDKFLSILPPFHCFGLIVCLHAPLCLGATAVLIPQFDPNKFDKLIKKYTPTVLFGVPTLFEALIKNKGMDSVDLSNVKYIISGGDTLTVTKNEQVNSFLKNHGCEVGIQQGYGMTETTGPVCFGALGSDKLGSVGIPLPGNIIKIVEPTTGLEVKTGEVGEICIAGPTVMKEYLDNKKETDDIKREEDGTYYIHSGDLGYLDKDGVLFYVQRLKRMIIVSGYNVYPSHIEDVIMELPFVQTCGVIGIPHPYKVQVPKAYIVLKDGVKADAELKYDIKKHCEKKLAKYMLPKEYEFKENLPKTMVGKVDYKVLEKENNK